MEAYDYEIPLIEDGPLFEVDGHLLRYLYNDIRDGNGALVFGSCELEAEYGRVGQLPDGHRENGVYWTDGTLRVCVEMWVDLTPSVLRGLRHLGKCCNTKSGRHVMGEVLRSVFGAGNVRAE
jgi:hypothetical protein